MSTITSLGVGSGLDLEGILNSLVEVESQKLTTIAKKQSSYETKLSAYSMVQSALSTFQSSVKSASNIDNYLKTTASSSNEDIATISSSGKAANGTYSMTVNQLATSQKLAANGVADHTVLLGKGTITIDFGEIVGGTLTDGKYTGATFESNNKGVKTIEIDESNGTLEGIRDAINAASIGVTATIINDGDADNPYRLVLSNSATGKEQSMKITVDGDDALKQLLTYDPAAAPDAVLDPANPDSTIQGMEQTQAAQNAEFILDGIKISRATNSASDVIDGVTLKLAKADPDETLTLNVSKDTGQAKSKVEELVKAYNDLVTTLKDLTSYNAEEKTASVLTGDSAVRSIQSSLKSMLSTTLSGSKQGYRMLSDVGIAVNKDGLLEIDSSKLGEALDNDFEAFATMFAEGGLSSNSAITFESAKDYAKTGTFDVEVTQVATTGSFTFNLGTQGLKFEGKSATDRTMQVSLNGASKSITLDEKNYQSNDEFAFALQSKINSAFSSMDASVSVEYDADASKFVVKSGLFGSDSVVKLTDSGDILINEDPETGKDVAGTINGVEAIGTGQKLTGASGSDAYGITIKVTGEDNVSGTVSFTQGFAYQFSNLAENLLSDDSAIQSRIEGMNESIKRAQKDYTNMQERIEAREALYRQQFTSLDLLVANMNATSSYLTQQLASISNLWNTKSGD